MNTRQWAEAIKEHARNSQDEYWQEIADYWTTAEIEDMILDCGSQKEAFEQVQESVNLTREQSR